MDSKKSSNSEIVDSVRKMTISRRGGVRTRGGRLPPISMRDIVQVTGTKKMVAPKIPQRRVAVKKEVTERTQQVPLIKTEAQEYSRESRDRGRGRGSKIILQTEGTFLSQGPALKIKREPSDYEKFSVPRYSARTASSSVKCDKRIPGAVKYLLKSDSSDEDCDESSASMLIRCFPPRISKGIKKTIPKENFIPKIKKEPLDEDDIKPVINGDDIKPVIDEDDIKPVIKKEPEDKWNALEGKFFTKLETDMKTEAKSAVDEFSNVKDKGMIILLQLPDCLPFTIDAREDASKDNEKADSKPPPSFFECLPEGYVGKLQILKSGKKRLMMGPLAFELVDGIPSDDKKEVVSMRLDGIGGDITILGSVEKKMVLKPDIGYLVEAAALNKELDNFGV